MDTARVDICYRPLRIAWAIRSDDREGFRRAVRLTHTMWGGRFNPIVFADRLDEARQIIELFRADMVVSVGCSAEVKEFPARFSYLISPLFPDELFLQWQDQHTRAHVLDIDNAFTKWRGTPDWQKLAEEGIWLFNGPTPTRWPTAFSSNTARIRSPPTPALIMVRCFQSRRAPGVRPP
jgi:hypothetical protein